MGFIDKSVMEVLAGKRTPERKTHCSTLEVYYETPVFIPVDITEDAVESVARKLAGDSRAQWYRLRRFTGVDAKIQGPQKKLY